MVADSVEETLDVGRVLIVHEWLVAWAGSERVVEELLRVFPEADLMVGIRATDAPGPRHVIDRAAETWLGRIPGARTHHRWLLPLHALGFATIDTSRYDLVVSSSHAFAKAVRARPGAKHLCYCHSPPRYLWDQMEQYGGGLVGLALRAFGGPLRALDRRTAARVDGFIANSQYVRKRIGRTYHRDARVVYPPVTPKPAGKTAARGRFLLCLGRLVPYKRTDIAIRGAQEAGVPLVIAGDGPERARLQTLAGPSTTFLGSVSEEQAGTLLEECAGLLFCGEEDFGIVGAEANLHGAPVICFGKGGMVEIVGDGAGGLTFGRQDAESACGAILAAMGRTWDERQLRANGARFSPAQFRAGIRDVVRSVVSA